MNGYYPTLPKSYAPAIFCPMQYYYTSSHKLSLGRSGTAKFAARHLHPVVEESQYCDLLEIGGCSGAEPLGELKTRYSSPGIAKAKP